jgi:DNA-binding LytR/AlgR family response regulator
MTTRCFIVDNESHAIRHLAKYINNTEGLELVGTETNPVIAHKKIIAGEIVADVTFLDIEMPQLNGLDLASLIQARTHIIFTTAHEHFALKAFDTDVTDYLLKPIAYPRFLKAVQKVQRNLDAGSENSPNERTHIYVQTEGKGKMIHIRIEDIYYVTSAQNYVQITLPDQSLLTYLTIKEMEDILPQGLFMRIHKSHLVNLKKISAVIGNMVHMENDFPIPLGPTYKAAFLELISPHIIRSSR